MKIYVESYKYLYEQNKLLDSMFDMLYDNSSRNTYVKMFWNY